MPAEVSSTRPGDVEFNHRLLHDVQRHLRRRVGDRYDSRQLWQIASSLGESTFRVAYGLERLVDVGVLSVTKATLADGWVETRYHVEIWCRCRRRMDGVGIATHASEPAIAKDADGGGIATNADTLAQHPFWTPVEKESTSGETGSGNGGIGTTACANPLATGLRASVVAVDIPVDWINPIHTDPTSPLRGLQNETQGTRGSFSGIKPLHDAAAEAEALEERGGLPGVRNGISGPVIRRGVGRGRSQWDPEKDTASGLAAYFDERTGGVRGWATNRKALASHIKRWIDGGKVTPAQVRKMISLYALHWDTDQYALVSCAWKDFVSRKEELLSKVKRNALGSREIPAGMTAEQVWGF